MTNEPKQIDTSTPEGWEKVIKHWLLGEEIELQTITSGWVIANDIHPSEWESDMLFRIKPAREPQVWEVWRDSEGDNVIILEPETADNQVRILYKSRELREYIDTFIPSTDLISFAGKTLDLSPLIGGES